MRFYHPTTREEILKLVSGIELNATFDTDSLKNVELLTRQNLKFKKKRLDTAKPSRILDWIDQDLYSLKIRPNSA